MPTKRFPAASRRQPPRTWTTALIVLAIGLGTIAWWSYPSAHAAAESGTAFGARTGCACRYIGGRELADCEKDFEPGMALVRLTADEELRSVTASVPLLAQTTATYRDGWGCLLDPYDS